MTVGVEQGEAIPHSANSQAIRSLAARQQVTGRQQQYDNGELEWIPTSEAGQGRERRG